MGCRTYFREGGLVVPKTGTTLEEMRQALAKHLEQDGTLEDLLATQTLGLEPLTGDPLTGGEPLRSHRGVRQPVGLLIG